MSNKMQGVDYTIVTVPDHIAYSCPHCDVETEMDFGFFMDLHSDEYDAWRGNNGIVVVCDYCGEEFDLLDSVLD